MKLRDDVKKRFNRLMKPMNAGYDYGLGDSDMEKLRQFLASELDLQLSTLEERVKDKKHKYSEGYGYISSGETISKECGDGYNNALESVLEEISKMRG